MTDGDALLRAVLEAPDDDAPRLIYADWLEESATAGDPCPRSGTYPSYLPCGKPCPVCRGENVIPDGRRERAEFIRVGCELARTQWVLAPGWMGGAGGKVPADVSKYDALRRRERELFRGRHDWLGVRPPATSSRTGDTTLTIIDGDGDRMKAEFYRGFAGALISTTADFLRWAPTVFKAHPVTFVRLADREPWDDNHVDSGSAAVWYTVRRDDYEGRSPYHPASDVPHALWRLLAGALDVDRRTKMYRTADAAHLALSAACVAYGRSRANLPPLSAYPLPVPIPPPAR